MMRAYIDTNILVDLVLSRQEFLPDAQRVFALGYAGEAQLIVTRNKKDFKTSTIAVLTAAEFIRQIDMK